MIIKNNLVHKQLISLVLFVQLCSISVQFSATYKNVLETLFLLLLLYFIKIQKTNWQFAIWPYLFFKGFFIKDLFETGFIWNVYRKTEIPTFHFPFFVIILLLPICFVLYKRTSLNINQKGLVKPNFSDYIPMVMVMLLLFIQMYENYQLANAMLHEQFNSSFIELSTPLLITSIASLFFLYKSIGNRFLSIVFLGFQCLFFFDRVLELTLSFIYSGTGPVGSLFSYIWVIYFIVFTALFLYWKNADSFKEVLTSNHLEIEAIEELKYEQFEKINHGHFHAFSFPYLMIQIVLILFHLNSLFSFERNIVFHLSVIICYIIGISFSYRGIKSFDKTHTNIGLISTFSGVITTIILYLDTPNILHINMLSIEVSFFVCLLFVLIYGTLIALINSKPDTFVKFIANEKNNRSLNQPFYYTIEPEVIDKTSLEKYSKKLIRWEIRRKLIRIGFIAFLMNYFISVLPNSFDTISLLIDPSSFIIFIAFNIVVAVMNKRIIDSLVHLSRNFTNSLLVFIFIILLLLFYSLYQVNTNKSITYFNLIIYGFWLVFFLYVNNENAKRKKEIDESY